MTSLAASSVLLLLSSPEAPLGENIMRKPLRSLATSIPRLSFNTLGATSPSRSLVATSLAAFSRLVSFLATAIASSTSSLVAHSGRLPALLFTPFSRASRIRLQTSPSPSEPLLHRIPTASPTRLRASGGARRRASSLNILQKNWCSFSGCSISSASIEAVMLKPLLAASREALSATMRAASVLFEAIRPLASGS